jgi:hypothetical protein
MYAIPAKCLICASLGFNVVASMTCFMYMGDDINQTQVQNPSFTLDGTLHDFVS